MQDYDPSQVSDTAYQDSYKDIADSLAVGIESLKDPAISLDTVWQWREIASMITSEKHPLLKESLHEMALLLEGHLNNYASIRKVHLVNRPDPLKKRQVFLQRYPRLNSSPVMQLPYDLSNQILSYTRPARLTVEDILKHIFGKSHVHPNTYIPLRDHLADLVVLGHLRYKPPVQKSPREFFYILKPEQRQEIAPQVQVTPETSEQLERRIRASIGRTATPQRIVSSLNNKTARKYDPK